MRKNKFILVILLFAFHCSLFTASAQSWKQLIDSANFYKAKGEDSTSLIWAEKTLTQSKVEFGELDTNLINTLNLIDNLFFNLGKIDSAIHYCKKELAISREIYKSDHENLTFILSWLGNLYDYAGQLDDAELVYKEALEMQRRLFKSDNPDLTVSLNNLASIYSAKGNFSEAEPLLKESLEIRRMIYKGDDPSVANGILNLAVYYDNFGRYTEAEPLYIEALAMNRRLYKQDYSDLAISINNMASFLNVRGRLTEAEPLYKEAFEMNSRLFDGDHPNLAMSLNNIAGFHNKMGRYELAEPLLKKALEMSKRLYKFDHPNLAICINNMAHFYDERGRYISAELLFNEALEIKRRLYKNNHPDLVVGINNLAKFIDERGRYKEAEPLYIEALEMSRKIYKDDHPDLSACISNTALFYHSRGRYVEAEPLFKEALDMRRRLYKYDNPDLAKSIYNLAFFYNDKGIYPEAETLYYEALNMYNNIVLNNFPSLSEKEKEQFWATMKDKFESFNSFALKRMKDNPNILCNFYDNQISTKALLFNSIDKIKRRIFYSGDSSLIKMYKKWISLKEYLVKLYSYTNDKLIKGKINLDSVQNLVNDIEKQLAAKSEFFAESYEKKKINWKTIQAFLKPDEAAVEIIRFRYFDKNFIDSICYAFLIITDKTTEHPDIVVLDNGKELEAGYYNIYRLNLKSEKPDIESFNNYWSKVYDKIKGIKKVYLSKDGIYNKINPSTFITPSDKYLLEEQDIQLCNSTKDIITGYFKTQLESNLLNSAELFGNPDYSMSQNNQKKLLKKNKVLKTGPVKNYGLKRLPDTETEILEIEKFLKSKKWFVKTYLGKTALKSNVKSLSNPRVLHIATHGIFLPNVKYDTINTLGFNRKSLMENPLLKSGLFLAGANSFLSDSVDILNDMDNGVLTAYEAMNLELDQTELVVLSACQTGLGEIRNGEGVYGLQRAFQAAGARTVLMSLWLVGDKSTSELMSKFYYYWVSGETKRSAFRKAQLDIFKKYKIPYIWGGFVMVGE